MPAMPTRLRLARRYRRDARRGNVTVTLIAGGTNKVVVACGAAIDNGEYPNLEDSHNVWNNDGPDASFGVNVVDLPGQY